MLDKDTHLGNSESREHSQNLRKKQAGADMGNVKVTVSAEDNKCSAVSSNFLEHSQNLLSSGEPEVHKREANVSFSDCDGQCLVTASEFRELSSNSRVKICDRLKALKGALFRSTLLTHLQTWVCGFSCPEMLQTRVGT